MRVFRVSIGQAIDRTIGKASYHYNVTIYAKLNRRSDCAVLNINDACTKTMAINTDGNSVIVTYIRILADILAVGVSCNLLIAESAHRRHCGV